MVEVDVLECLGCLLTCWKSSKLVLVCWSWLGVKGPFSFMVFMLSMFISNFFVACLVSWNDTSSNSSFKCCLFSNVHVCLSLVWFCMFAFACIFCDETELVFILSKPFFVHDTSFKCVYNRSELFILTGYIKVRC